MTITEAALIGLQKGIDLCQSFNSLECYLSSTNVSQKKKRVQSCQ